MSACLSSVCDSSVAFTYSPPVISTCMDETIRAVQTRDRELMASLSVPFVDKEIHFRPELLRLLKQKCRRACNLTPTCFVLYKE